MSEMLANRYFIARKFDLALPVFEEELAKGNNDIAIKKKLIICYGALGQIDKAFELFFELVNKDPFVIINTDPYWDDCPCPEMIKHWEKTTGRKEFSPREYLILGMLYLYCDLDKSIEYLQKALDYDEYFLKINSVLRILRNARKTSH